MSRRRHKKMTEEEYYNQFLYGGWNPHDYDYVWLENGAYANLERELAYYRCHPENVKPDELLRFLNHIMDEWHRDTARYQKGMKEMIARCEDMLEAMRGREEVYQRLKSVLRDIQTSLREQEAQQAQIERRLRAIEDERTTNQRKALELRNEAVTAFNAICNDPYFQKYAMAELDAISQQLSQLDNRQLAAEAMQAVAVNALNRVFAATEMVGRKKVEFSTAQLLADTEASLIMEQFAHWRDHVYFDEARHNKVDMDFWSFDHFGEVMRAAQTLCDRIRGGELATGYMVEDLEQDLEEIKSLQAEGEATVASVFNNCNVSEQCEQLGLITAAILYEDFHFKLIANGFDGDDLRHGYVIEMENHAMGCRMRFVYSPISQTQSVGCYQMYFLDYIDQMLLASFEQMLIRELQDNDISLSTHRNRGQDTLATVVDSLEFTPSGSTIHLPDGMRIWEKQRVPEPSSNKQTR